MLVRRLFLRWQYLAIVVLPAWLFVGQVIFGESTWGVVGMLIAAPITFVALGIIALLVSMRPTVRKERAASWTDVGVLGAWHAAIIAAGFSGELSTTFGLLAIAFALAAFWVSLWQLVRDGARTMSATMEGFEQTAANSGPTGSASRASGSPSGRDGDDDDDDVIIIHERRD